MKTVKISLTIIVIAAILFGVYKWYDSIIPPPAPISAENQFISKIEQEIQELARKPDDKFCKEYYTEVAYHIEDYHKNGRLSENLSENNQWKENLSQQLYSAYTDKFINQAFYVFNRFDWEFNDLIFIRDEFKILQNSPMLEENSPVNEKFIEIQRIFTKYDEIVSLILISEKFSFSATDLSTRFPNEEVIQIISKVKSLQMNNLGNTYVNKCGRLHNGLDDVSEVLFRAHVRYLDNKIDAWSGMYSNYNSQKTYADNLYIQILNELDELDNDIYISSNFSREYSRLKRKWQADAQKAYDYFDKK